MLDHLAPIAVIAQHQLAVVVAAGWAKVAGDRHAVLLFTALIELLEEAFAHLGWDEMQWLLVHRARFPITLLERSWVEVALFAEVPIEGIQRAALGARVMLEALLQAAHDRRL